MWWFVDWVLIDCGTPPVCPPRSPSTWPSPPMGRGETAALRPLGSRFRGNDDLFGCLFRGRFVGRRSFLLCRRMGFGRLLWRCVRMLVLGLGVGLLGGLRFRGLVRGGCLRLLGVR